jgi:hypothetical protein
MRSIRVPEAQMWSIRGGIWKSDFDRQIWGNRGLEYKGGISGVPRGRSGGPEVREESNRAS